MENGVCVVAAARTREEGGEGGGGKGGVDGCRGLKIRVRVSRAPGEGCKD
jgi:hypothetical protein